MNQLRLFNYSKEKPEGIVIVKEPNLVEQEASLCKSWDLDGMAYCDTLSEEIGHHEGMDAVDGLPAVMMRRQQERLSQDRRPRLVQSSICLWPQVWEMWWTQRRGHQQQGIWRPGPAQSSVCLGGSSEADGAHAEERALSGAIKSEASAEEHLPLTENIDAGGYAEERTLPGMVSVELKASAEERLPLTENIDAGGYAEERTLPGMVSVELKVSAEERLSENETLMVSAEQRAPMEVRDGEQQALDEVEIAPSANSSVSMDRVYAEEWAHVDPASTESHAHELEMLAEQRVLQQAAYSEQLASASDINAKERTRQARVHTEQRVLQEGEALDPEPLVGDTPCIRQFTWEEPAGVSMMVPVRFGDMEAVAVVDTAAQVTIMNHELRTKIGLQGRCDETVMLRNAKKDSAMQGDVWKHVGFQLGGRKYFCDIVEADISNALILGIDFLWEQKCKIDLGNDALEMQDREQVCASMRGQEAGVYHVSRVLLAKKAKVPPVEHSICRG